MSTSVTKLFGLTGDNWMRHANPVSVWTRFAVLPLLALAVWSREWIGWWSLAAVALALVFMMVNPLLFPPPRSTRHWASKAVFGERIWTDRAKAELPPQFRGSGVTYATYASRSPAWPSSSTGWSPSTSWRSSPGCSSCRRPRPGSSTAWCCCSRT
jgi:hypothetical protein